MAAWGPSGAFGGGWVGGDPQPTKAFHDVDTAYRPGAAAAEFHGIRPQVYAHDMVLASMRTPEPTPVAYEPPPMLVLTTVVDPDPWYTPKGVITGIIYPTWSRPDPDIDR